VLHRTHVLATRVREAYDAFEFHVIYHALNNFCAVDLSSLYLDVRKDRLYCEKPDGVGRRGTQTVLHAVCDLLLRAMAPVLSFTAEEAWAFLPGATTESVFLAGFVVPPAAWNDPVLAARYEQLLALRGEVTKAIEAVRREGAVKQSTEVRVVVTGPEPVLATLRATQELETVFNVATVDLSPGDAVRVDVEKASGSKCERCWNLRALGSHPGHPTLCTRCAEVVA